MRQTASQDSRKLNLYFHTWNFKVVKTLKKHMLSLEGRGKRVLGKKKSVDKTGWQIMPHRESLKVEIKLSE